MTGDRRSRERNARRQPNYRHRRVDSVNYITTTAATPASIPPRTAPRPTRSRFRRRAITRCTCASWPVPNTGNDDSFYLPTGFNTTTSWAAPYNTSSGGATAAERHRAGRRQRRHQRLEMAAPDAASGRRWRHRSRRLGRFRTARSPRPSPGDRAKTACCSTSSRSVPSTSATPWAISTRHVPRAAPVRRCRHRLRRRTRAPVRRSPPARPSSSAARGARAVHR